MWSAEITILENNLTKYKIYQNTKRMCFQDVIELLKNNTEFIRFFNELLSTSPYEAYFWEVKPTTLNRQDDDFEFVLINSPALLRIHADDKTFSKYFDGNKNAISFSNLGGDSRLIVPVEISDSTNYSHIAKFVRNALEEQMIAFWNLVGEEFSKAIDNKTKWLSTSGLGVHWLHVRIDLIPKYYNYTTYKEMK